MQSYFGSLIPVRLFYLNNAITVGTEVDSGDIEDDSRSYTEIRGRSRSPVFLQENGGERSENGRRTCVFLQENGPFPEPQLKVIEFLKSD